MNFVSPSPIKIVNFSIDESSCDFAMLASSAGFNEDVFSDVTKINIVSVIGNQKLGKSTLLNKILDIRSFAVGSNDCYATTINSDAIFVQKSEHSCTIALDWQGMGSAGNFLESSLDNLKNDIKILRVSFLTSNKIIWLFDSFSMTNLQDIFHLWLEIDRQNRNIECILAFRKGDISDSNAIENIFFRYVARNPKLAQILDNVKFKFVIIPDITSDTYPSFCQNLHETIFNYEDPFLITSVKEWCDYYTKCWFQYSNIEKNLFSSIYNGFEYHQLTPIHTAIFKASDDVQSAFPDLFKNSDLVISDTIFENLITMFRERLSKYLQGGSAYLAEKYTKELFIDKVSLYKRCMELSGCNLNHKCQLNTFHISLGLNHRCFFIDNDLCDRGRHLLPSYEHGQQKSICESCCPEKCRNCQKKCMVDLTRHSEYCHQCGDKTSLFCINNCGRSKEVFCCEGIMSYYCGIKAIIRCANSCGREIESLQCNKIPHDNTIPSEYQRKKCGITSQIKCEKCDKMRTLQCNEVLQPGTKWECGDKHTDVGMVILGAGMAAVGAVISATLAGAPLGTQIAMVGASTIAGAMAAAESGTVGIYVSTSFNSGPLTPSLVKNDSVIAKNSNVDSFVDHSHAERHLASISSGTENYLNDAVSTTLNLMRISESPRAFAEGFTQYQALLLSDNPVIATSNEALSKLHKFIREMENKVNYFNNALGLNYDMPIQDIRLNNYVEENRIYLDCNLSTLKQNITLLQQISDVCEVMPTQAHILKHVPDSPSTLVANGYTANEIEKKCGRMKELAPIIIQKLTTIKNSVQIPD